VNRPDDLIIAHRGESSDAPENTLAAINLAWEREVKSVEIDIQLTSDNEIVVIHDYDTLRISGEKKIIKNTSLKELKLLDAGSHKSRKWKGEPIPTLNEVLITVPEHGRLIIEIKSDERILGKLKNDLARSGLRNSQIEIISFNEDTLAKARQLMPEYKMLWLLDLDYHRPWWLCRINERKIIRKVKKLDFNGVDVWSGKILSKEFIANFKDAGLMVYVWTVNDPGKAKWLIESGIDGITSDRAHWIAGQIK
jgi:glycerophosphoryl diester phosphodiesterase